MAAASERHSVAGFMTEEGLQELSNNVAARSWKREEN